jgi:peptide/nickel transport system permease protein
MLALAIILLLGITAIFGETVASAITGHGLNEQFHDTMQDEFGVPYGPNGQFYFGADSSGRDLFVRVMAGARPSLIVGGLATGIAVGIGLIVGLLAGYFGGFIDTLLSRGSDVMLAIPQLLLSVGIVASCSSSKDGCLAGTIKPGIGLVVAIIAIFTWPYIARIVRGFTLSIREKEFVEASRSLGAGHTRIILREIVPNLIAPIIVYTTLLVPQNILIEASLSFLGLGLPAAQPSWGQILSDAREYYNLAWWLFLFPGLFLIVTTLAFNLLGDGLRDALDVRGDR